MAIINRTVVGFLIEDVKRIVFNFLTSACLAALIFCCFILFLNKTAVQLLFSVIAVKYWISSTIRYWFFSFVVFVSFIEIYNEQIYDLLQPIAKISKRPNLRLAEDKSRPFVKNLQEIQVSLAVLLFPSYSKRNVE